MLTGLGRTWTSVDADAQRCDVAYALPGEPVPDAGLRIDVDEAAWSDGGRSVRRLLQFRGDEPYDFPADCFAVLSGADERSWRVNRFGQLVPGGSAFEGEDVRLACPVSRAFRLADQLLEGSGAPPASHPRWPGGRSWAACASHDVDYPLVIRWLEPLRVLARRRTAGAKAALGVARGSRHHWHFDSWMELERELGFRSAFYFSARRGSLRAYALGDRDPFYDIRDDRFAELFRRLDDEGCEIGLHASYRAYEEDSALKTEKRTLEAAAGREVEGGRHHYWRLHPEEPERTLARHAEAGLAYDCSLSFDHQVGWRRGCSWPFWPFSGSRRSEVGTLELSTAWMDEQLFSHGDVNGTSTDDDRAGKLELLRNAAAADGGLLVTDVHEYVYDDQLFPGRAASYRRFWEEVASRSDVWIATPGEVARHWSRRAADIRARSTGLECA